MEKNLTLLFRGAGATASKIESELKANSIEVVSYDESSGKESPESVGERDVILLYIKPQDEESAQLIVREVLAA